MTLAQPGISPFETFGHDVSNIGEVEEEQRNAYNGVEYGHQFSNRSDWSNMPIACKESFYVIKIQNSILYGPSSF